jgi:hypothetical protein
VLASRSVGDATFANHHWACEPSIGAGLIVAHPSRDSFTSCNNHSGLLTLPNTAMRTTPSGQNAQGAVVGKMAMELAIKKAKECGVAWVVARNSNHYGIAGWYAMMVSMHSQVLPDCGCSCTHQRHPCVCVTFSRSNFLFGRPDLPIVRLNLPIGRPPRVGPPRVGAWHPPSPRIRTRFSHHQRALINLCVF